MQYLITEDETFKDILIEKGFRLLNIRRSLRQGDVYTFEYDEKSSHCFNINDTSVKQKCIVTDKLSMTF